MFSAHGKELSQAAFDKSKAEVSRHWNDRLDHSEALNILYQIVEIEEDHKEELEQEAVRIISEVWGIDPSQLRPSLESDAMDTGQSESDQVEIGDLPSDQGSSDIAPHVRHRVTLNTLTQGAATHHSATIHHMAREALDRIDPQLLSLYSKLMSHSIHAYWIVGFPMPQGMGAGISAAGDERVEWESPEADEPGAEPGTSEVPIVYARGLTFPVLLHELSKGVMEIITSRQISKHDPDTQARIVRDADKFAYEPLQIMVGPEIWQRFLRAMKANNIAGNKIAEVVSLLSDADPDVAEEFIDGVIRNPEDTMSLLSGLYSIEEGAPVAPTKPKAPPRPTHPRPRPSKPSRIDPFKPPRPGVLPKPKFQSEEELIDEVTQQIEEDYDEEYAPQIERTSYVGPAFHGTSVYHDFMRDLEQGYSDWEATWITPDEYAAEEFAEDREGIPIVYMMEASLENLADIQPSDIDAIREFLGGEPIDPRECFDFLRNQGFDGWFTLGSIGSQAYNDIAIFYDSPPLLEAKLFIDGQWTDYMTLDEAEAIAMSRNGSLEDQT